MIENHFIFPNGRHLVSTVGTERVRISEIWTEEGGYNAAKVEYFNDQPQAPSVHSEVEHSVARIKDLLKKKQFDLEEAEEKQGKMPLIPDNFSWWLAGVLTISAKEKTRLLATKSLFERLTLLEMYTANQ